MVKSKTDKYEYYAVKVGKNPGIYSSWDECKQQTTGFPGNKYKGFNDKLEAHEFLFESDNSKICEESHHKAKKKRQLEKEESEDDLLITKKLKDSCDSLITIQSVKTQPFKNDPANTLNFSFNLEPVKVYTDGACSANGQANAKAGYGVWWADNHPLNLSEKLLGTPTNQRAELAAAIAAVQQAIQYRAGTLTIFTDSKYVINCVTEWILKWKKNGWLATGKKPVANMEEIKLLDSLCAKHKVVWEHVRGHKGIYGNERADELARKAFQ